MQEPSRRRYIKATAATTVVCLAGCVSMELFEDGDDELTEESEGGTIDNDGGQAGTDDAGAENEGSPDESTRREIAETYNDGVGDSNDGMAARNDAVSAFNNDQLQRAKNQAESAEASFSRAKEQFSDALDLAYQIDHDRAIEICSDSEERARLMESAMAYTVQAAESGQDGNIDNANSLINQARDIETDAQRITVRNPETLADVLDVR